MRLARAGDCVLLLGKGHERSIIWGMEKRPWDEAAAALGALADLGYVNQDAVP
jgi:UDP-N-acetylmuramoyl-L-alanyl-D-glutamate--2,6-diaminopimelate ligase